MGRSQLWPLVALLVALAAIPSASALAWEPIDGCLSVGDNECGGGPVDVCWHFDPGVVDADAQAGPGIGFKVWVPFVGFDGNRVKYGTQEVGYHPEC